MHHFYLASNNIFYAHTFETLFVVAILFTFIGCLFGSFLWRHHLKLVQNIKANNKDLKRKRDSVEQRVQNLEHILHDIT